jgi:hypothetical protein
VGGTSVFTIVDVSTRTNIRKSSVSSSGVDVRFGVPLGRRMCSLLFIFRVESGLLEGKYSAHWSLLAHPTHHISIIAFLFFLLHLFSYQRLTSLSSRVSCPLHASSLLASIFCFDRDF